MFSGLRSRYYGVQRVRVRVRVRVRIGELVAPDVLPPSEADQNAVMTGTAVSSVPPVPSCPFEFHPQHRTV